MKKILQVVSILVAISLLTISCLIEEPDEISPLSNTGGALARFTILGGQLYLIDVNDLKVFQIDDPLNMEEVEENFIGSSSVILGASNGYLFVGSDFNLRIVSVENLETIYVFFNLSKCDQVDVQNEYLYVLRRSEVGCRQGVNQLEIYNISNIEAPITEKSINLFDPMGLAIEGNQLFIAEGEVGLRQFAISDPLNPIEIRLIDDIVALDVTAENGLLMVVGLEKLFQYQFQQDGEISFLSSVTFN
jgi:hypothetical protein